MDVGLLSSIIAAGTSILVTILSQILIRRKEKKQVLEDENRFLLKQYINPMRFMLAENYYRFCEIMKNKEKRESLLYIDEATEILEKNSDWFVGNGCYLMSSCYLMACLFAYMENIRNNMPFLRVSRKKDTELIKLINKLVVDFSSDLSVYYVIQMNIGKECYIRTEDRVVTYREFCELLENKENFIWYKALVEYF